jgi:hypothetical protein
MKAEVYRLRDAGMPENSIASVIRLRGFAEPLSADDVVALKAHGWSEYLIDTMLQYQRPPARVEVVEVYGPNSW